MTNDEQIENMKSTLLQMAEAIAEGSAGKIHAIKCYRSATGAGLLESKEWVERRYVMIDRISKLEARVTALEGALR